MSKWTPGAHGGTYGGNPVTCAAGVATLDVLTRHLPDVFPLGEKTLAFLHSQLDCVDTIGDIRGEGLMIGIEFVKDKTTKTPHAELMKQVMARCLERGLIVISCGIYDNVIRLIPPIIIDESTLMTGLSILTEVIHEYN